MEDSVIALRAIVAGDMDFLAEVYASTRADELAVTGWAEEQKAAFCRMQFDAQHAHYQKHYSGASFQVIERGGTSVGRLYVDRWAQEIRIVDIALMPGSRGQGIGTQLLRELQREAQETGKVLSIHVERMNPALRLYERLGFRVREDKGVYLLMEWSGE
ncbi:MAG: N-acetyltransferase [Verrucomicrobiaceae bacterium]|nr:MAG: N-acetyltransferase [Verrucomicrobiaceae bacterium]